ncbi:MAG: type I 3-dehydroquinate dehydratase [Nitrososphaerales archaeon]
MPSAEYAHICTSIPASSLTSLQTAIEKAFSYGSDYVEVRFDYLDMRDIDKLKPILKRYADRCIYTCRRTEEGGRFQGDEEARSKVLKKLAEQNPAFIDIELSTVKEKPDLAGSLRSGGSSLIVSWHNFSETPSREVLKSVQEDALGFGDVAKIVTFAKRFEDNASILSLYRSAGEGRLIAFCMGELGVVSRVVCALIGSPLTYASLENDQTAPGQISVKELKEFYAAL